MSDLETRFHETWRSMVQPVEGLVVSALVFDRPRLTPRTEEDRGEALSVVALPRLEPETRG